VDVREITNEIIKSGDLIKSGELLQRFVDECSNEKNKLKCIDLLYKQLGEFALPDYAMDFENKYYACEGANAIIKYLYFGLPRRKNSKESLQAIKEYADTIVARFYKPTSEQLITKNRIGEIIGYLDKEFNFCNKVFPKRKPIFAILDYANTHFNAESLMTFENEGADIYSIHVFLYRTKQDTDSPYKTFPEYVFAHELGHMLQTVKENQKPGTASQILTFIHKNLGLVKLDDMPPEDELEFLADTFSTGMLHQSPFAKYDPFKIIPNNYRDIYKKMITDITNSL